MIDVNLNGSFFTAQSAVRQMQRFGNGGSVILVASAAGSIAAKVRALTLNTMVVVDAL